MTQTVPLSNPGDDNGLLNAHTSLINSNYSELPLSALFKLSNKAHSTRIVVSMSFLDITAFFVPILLVIILIAFIIASIITVTFNDNWNIIHDVRFWDAFLVSLSSSITSSLMAVMFAIPFAYILSREMIRGTKLIEVLSQVLLGLPPVGVGLAILIAFSSIAPGRVLDSAIRLLFDFKGVVLAQFLVIFPIVIRFVKEVIDMVPRSYEEVFLVHGVPRITIFFSIILPLSFRGIVAAWLVGWMRSLGEFGATVVVSGMIRGKTETLTVYMYNLLSSADFISSAQVLVVMLLIVVLTSILIYLLTGKTVRQE